MRPRTGRACAVVALAAVTAFFAVTPTAVAGLGDNRFQVTARTVSEHYQDIGHEGPSVGDTYTFSDNLFHHGQRVGRDDGTCHVTRVHRRNFAFHCTVTLTLRGRGQIATQGTLSAAGFGKTTLAITGGTKDYFGASGTLTVVQLRGEPERLRIHLEG